MTKNACIINPWITDFKLYDEWMHPLGLYFLISLLKYNNWDITYINCLERKAVQRSKRFNTASFPFREMPSPPIYRHIPRRYKRYGITEQALREKLSNCKPPDIICIGSGMTYWIDGLKDTVKIVQQRFPHVPVVIGGIGATLMQEVLKKSIPGKVSIHSGSLRENFDTLRMLDPHFQTLACDGWEPGLIDAFELIKPRYHGPLLTSFGCPQRCSYCASSLLQPSFIQRSHELVFSEARYLSAHCHITDCAFYDDALLFQAEKHFIPLMNMIAQLPAPIRLHTPNGLHVRHVTPEVLRCMKQTGFQTLRFGYETGTQLQTHKKTDKKQLTEKIKLIQSFGFAGKDIGVYVMAGLAHQTFDDVYNEISFIASLGVLVKPVTLSPIPHTPLFKYYETCFPILKTEPLAHNDTFFITVCADWNWDKISRIKHICREHNKRLLQ